MKNDFLNKETDEIIRASMRLTDEPAPELDKRLKAALYQREAALRKQPAARSLSLWYLPMLLNLATFLMLAAAALLTIDNIYLAFFAAGICLYIALAGVLLTAAGVKRTNMKYDITILFEKRGVFA